MLFTETISVIVKTIRNKQTHSVGRIEGFSILKQVVHIENHWALKGLHATLKTSTDLNEAYISCAEHT
jgi:hypothetical protein